MLYLTARYTGNYIEAEFQHSLGESMEYAGDFSVEWENAKAGKLVHWRFGYSEGDFGDYHAGGAFVLPDDPSFAGAYNATISFGDLVKTVTFTLVYDGDYETGTGWSITDVVWM